MDSLNYVLMASKLVFVLPLGMFGWICWRIRSLVFRRMDDSDFEKKLKHLSKEEVALHSRMKRRSDMWRKISRSIISYACIIEVLLIAYGVWSTKNENIPWKIRSFRVSLVFLFPSFSYVIYIFFSKYFSFCHSRDFNALERLRAERKAKIDELKEKTNFYRTQELIQQYDSDPTAATLASKKGTPKSVQRNSSRSSDVRLRNVGPPASRAQNSIHEPSDVKGSTFPEGLRKRKSSMTVQGSHIESQKSHPHSSDPLRSNSSGVEFGFNGDPTSKFKESQERGFVKGHGIGTMAAAGQGAFNVLNDTGLFSRIATMLVGEDPTQCYALICERCHSHNGLANKDDFPFVAYFCPRCQHFNPGKHQSSLYSQHSSPSPQHDPSTPQENHSITEERKESEEREESERESNPILPSDSAVTNNQLESTEGMESNREDEINQLINHGSDASTPM